MRSKTLSNRLKTAVEERLPLVANTFSKARQIVSSRIVDAQYPLISKRTFIHDLKHAVDTKTGYAAGKTGPSQQHWMYYEIFLAKGQHELLSAFEKELYFHCLKQEGVFPANSKFYLEFSRFYVSHLRNVNCLGIFYLPNELEIIRYYNLKNKFIHYLNQEPDRSSPNNERKCYLQYFKGKKLLIICPFADVLKERAIAVEFEKIWAKTGKKWFYPESVDSLEFPYGFSPETHKKYKTVLDLFEFIMRQIEKKDFDIALVAAGGLSIPIISSIKNMGKVAIDLGGHLQVLFGIIGARWRDWDDWKQMYFNEHWIDMPTQYKPKELDVCDQGAYW